MPKIWYHILSDQYLRHTGDLVYYLKFMGLMKYWFKAFSDSVLLAVYCFFICPTIYAKSCVDLFVDKTYQPKPISLVAQNLSKNHFILDTNLAGFSLKDFDPLRAYALSMMRSLNQNINVIEAVPVMLDPFGDPSQFPDFFFTNRETGKKEFVVFERLMMDRSYRLKVFDELEVPPAERLPWLVSARFFRSGMSPSPFILGKLLQLETGKDEVDSFYTPKILTELFTNEFQEEGSSLAPKETEGGLAQAALNLGLIPQELNIVNSATGDSIIRDQILKTLKDVEVGGKKGEADQQIIADVFLAKTEPGVTPRFATNDKNIVRGLLRLSLRESAVIDFFTGAHGEDVIPHLLEGKVSNLYEFPSIERPFLAVESQAIRVAVFRGIRIPGMEDSTNPVDLYYFFNSPGT